MVGTSFPEHLKEWIMTHLINPSTAVPDLELAGKRIRQDDMSS
jgi:hypothetical protein